MTEVPDVKPDHLIRYKMPDDAAGLVYFWLRATNGACRCGAMSLVPRRFLMPEANRQTFRGRSDDGSRH